MNVRPGTKSMEPSRVIRSNIFILASANNPDCETHRGDQEVTMEGWKARDEPLQTNLDQSITFDLYFALRSAVFFLFLPFHDIDNTKWKLLLIQFWFICYDYMLDSFSL